MTVWRIFLDPERPEGSRLMQSTFDFCIERGLLGIGWGLEPNSPVSLSDYEMLAGRQYDGRGGKGWRSAFNAIRDMKRGDFCWTHRPGGDDFHLGLILGDWTYRWERPYWDAGLAQTRDCVWRRWRGEGSPVGYPEVESRAMNRIRGVAAERAAERAWAESG